jgi:hypothetical protein
VAAYDMRKSLNDSLEDKKKKSKKAIAKSIKLEKPKGISKMKKTKAHKVQKALLKSVRKPVMHCPFMIDDSDDEEEEEKKSTVNNDSQSVVDSTSTTTTPAPGLSFSLPIHQGPPPSLQPAPAPPTSSSTTIMAAPTTTAPTVAAPTVAAPATTAPPVDPAAAAAANISQQVGTAAFSSSLDNLIDDSMMSSMINRL